MSILPLIVVLFGGDLVRVLVGCECSQVVLSAFLALGHEVFSCDLAACYGDHPDLHFQGDLREVYDFVKPDLFIAHPPCTYLSRAGLCCLVDSFGVVKDWVRYEQMLLGRDFFLWCLSRPAPMVCIENPVPMVRAGLPSPSQIIQPYFFGDPFTKQTCLWLRGLAPLQMSHLVRPIGSWTDLHKSPRIRSKTFSGVAAAMADTWGRGFNEIQLSFGF